VADILASGVFLATSEERLRGLLERHHAVEEAREVANDFARLAVATLADLPPGPELEALAVAPRFIVDRDY
jgi:geranylgeranyl pyrophosphate synthase